MKKTMYVVTDGAYSDYHICAVFDDKEKAEEFTHFYGGAEIEEYALNPDFREEARFYKEGYWPFTLHYFVAENRFSPRQCQWDHYGKIDPSPNYCKPIADGKEWFIELIARDEKQAVKIANERIAQMKAMGMVGKSIEEFNKCFPT